MYQPPTTGRTIFHSAHYQQLVTWKITPGVAPLYLAMAQLVVVGPAKVRAARHGWPGAT